MTILEIQVRVGITNIRGGEHSLQQRSITKIERHEEYLPGSLQNDIALLKLSGELEITDFVRPICLWEGSGKEDLIVGKDGYVAGWGQDEKKTLSYLLKYAVMPIVSQKTCGDSDPHYYPMYLYGEKTFCAGYGNGTSASVGDSGGGLFLEVNGTWMIRGIISNGKADKTKSLDTSSFVVFTNVAYFITWIRNKMELPIEDITKSDDKYATCGNNPRPSYQRNKDDQYRIWPWLGHVRSVNKPSIYLCVVAIINEFYVLAPADRIADKYLPNLSQLEIVFHRNNGEILSTHRIERILRHENFARSSRMNNIALLELTDKLTFNYFLQPTCIGIFSEASLGENYGECEPSIRATNPHAYCYQEKNITKEPSNFDSKILNGKFFLLGVIVDKFINNEKSANILVIANISFHVDWIETNTKMPSKLYSLEECPENGSKTAPVSFKLMGQPAILLCFGSMITKSLIVTVATCVADVSLESL